MLCFPMDFGEITNYGLIDTGALTSAISQTDLRKTQFQAAQTNLNEGPPPELQINNGSEWTFRNAKCIS